MEISDRETIKALAARFRAEADEYNQRAETAEDMAAFWRDTGKASAFLEVASALDDALEYSKRRQTARRSTKHGKVVQITNR